MHQSIPAALRSRYPASRGPLIFLDKLKGLCSRATHQLNSKNNCPVSLVKGAFQKSELSGRTRHFGNKIGFFQEVLLNNHLLYA